MKNKSIDGLRGIAALNVAISHFICAFLPMMLHGIYPTIFTENKNPSALFEIATSPIFSILYNGHFAVLIFFVLSGYVLTIPYFRNDDTSILKQRFWGRYLRLNIPIAAAIALSYSIYKMGLYSNVQASEVSGSINWLNNYFKPDISFITAVKQSLYQSIFYGVGSFIPPLWTIKIELIGSLYILVFYVLKPKKQTVLPLIFAFLFLYAIYESESIFFVAIFIGSCLNYLKIRKSLNFIIFIAGIYFGSFQFQNIFYNFLPEIKMFSAEVWPQLSFYNTVGATLVSLAVINGFGRNILESKFFQFLGEISYSFYLLHFIILCAFSCTMYLKLPQENSYLLINFICYLLACFLLSKLFSVYIDKKAISVTKNFLSFFFKENSQPELKQLSRDN